MITPDHIRLMDLFVNDAKVQKIRENGKACEAAWKATCQSAALPQSDYAETLRLWHSTQTAPRGGLRVSTPKDGVVTVSMPAAVEGGSLHYTLQVRTLLLQALAAYAAQYTDPVRFLRDAEGLARSVASRILLPPEPR